MNWRKVELLVLLVSGTALLLSACVVYEFHGTLLQSPDPAADFTLTSMNGQAVSLSDFRGKLVVLYFGYTYCPDVCPTTLAEIKKALAKMGEQADAVQVIMVTVDPERDTPQLLNDYLSSFDQGFLGLTGPIADIQRVATLYGIYFARAEGSDATGYLVDHTASVIVIDQEGYLKLVFPYGTPADDIAADLEYLLSH
jgi:protein SCO1/2